MNVSVPTELIIIFLIVLVIFGGVEAARSSPARWARPRRSSRPASTRATRPTAKPTPTTADEPNHEVASARVPSPQVGNLPGGPVVTDDA